MPASEATPEHTHWNLTSLFWLSLAFLLGIFLGSSTSMTGGNWVLLGGGSLALFLALMLMGRLRSRSTATLPGRIAGFRGFLSPVWTKTSALYSRLHIPVHPLLLLAVIAFGAARYRHWQPVLSTASLASYNDGQYAYIIEGNIVKPPEYREMQTYLVVRVDRLRPVYDMSFTNVNGLLLAEVSSYKNWHYGDRIRLEGELHTPPASEDFSYGDYLAGRGIYSLIESPQAILLEHGRENPILSAIYIVRERAYATIYNLFPDPEASLFAGILLGMDANIPAHVEAAFIATGTSHIIAISGFNIAIVSALLVILFRRLLGRWRAAVATMVGIALYTVFVGTDAAVVRAAILGGLSLLAAQLGRRQVGLNSLAVIAAVMALAKPVLLWDLSYQLSFTATLGMILYAEVFSERFKRHAGRWLSPTMLPRIAAPVSEYFLITIAAQILTLPVIAYHFNRISLVSLLANPVILPAQPPLMVLGGIATVLGVIFFPLGKFVAALAWPFALYTIRMVEFFARIPSGDILLGDVALPLILLFYAVLFMVTFASGKFRENLGKIKPAVPLAGLFILTFLIWQVASTRPDSRLHLTLLDVSNQSLSGHAILIDTPTGRRILINGGPYASLLSDALGRRLPWTNHHLDWLMIAATSENELSALHGTIERYSPDHVLWAGATHANTVSRNLWEALILLQTPVTRAEIGQTLELGDGAELRVLDTCQRGSVLLLEWQNFRALLPLGIDLEYLEQTDFGRKIGAMNVLLLAESGYTPVNPSEWIANLNPQLILLSVAGDDAHGLPSDETLQAIEGYELLRTDQNGWIELSTDGKEMWVEVERK